MTVIAVANQKGGVGKTTTVRNLGHFLASYGATLMIDLDPQHTLTDVTGVTPTRGTMADVLGDVDPGTVPLSSIICPVADGLDLAPSSSSLATSESGLVVRKAREFQLQRSIPTVVQRYEWVLIDCPPSLGWLVTNALIAAEWVIVPVQLAMEAVNGLALFVETLTALHEDYGQGSGILGTAATEVNTRTVLGRELWDKLQSNAYLRPFATPIPSTVRFREAAAMRKSIAEYEPDSPGAKAYEALAMEVIQRVKV